MPSRPSRRTIAVRAEHAGHGGGWHAQWRAGAVDAPHDDGATTKPSAKALNNVELELFVAIAVGRRLSPGADRSVRRWLFWVLVFGLVGTGAELLLLGHYEEPWQVAPIVLIALAIAALARHRSRRDSWSLRTFQVLMVLFLAAGLLGVALHFDGAAEFQREIDPAIGAWNLVKKVMRAKAPPVLAPGVMLQLRLLVCAVTDRGQKE